MDFIPESQNILPFQITLTHNCGPVFCPLSDQILLLVCRCLVDTIYPGYFKLLVHEREFATTVLEKSDLTKTIVRISLVCSGVQLL